MSSPRAATSDATRKRSDPSRNPSSVAVRTRWSRSPWIGAASYPCALSDLATMSTSVLRLQKMIAFFSPPVSVSGPSASISARSNSRFCFAVWSLRVGVSSTSFWVIVSDVVAWRATSMRSGACRKVFVIRSISGAMVALKNSVCRVKGVSWKMRSISGMNPMSSIRSASSTTMIWTPVSNSLPRSKWSSRRPGVAISTSTPRSISLSCSPKLTPPISSALVSRVCLA